MANYNVTAADAAWLESVYISVLDRPSDIAGREYWLNQLAQTGDGGRESIINAIRQSPEGQVAGTPQSNPVEWLNSIYLSVLDRPFEQEGASYWLNQLGEGGAPEDIVNALQFSPEGQVAGSPLGNPFAWLDSVYMTILGRPADKEGQDYWISQLLNTGDAAGVVHDIWQFAKKPTKVPNRPLMANAGIPETAGEKIRKRYVNLGGRKTTILTGPQGLWDAAPSAAPVLLGG